MSTPVGTSRDADAVRFHQEALEAGVLYLDVDGVIATWPGHTYIGDEWPDARAVAAAGRYLMMSREMLTRIDQLPARIVWHTTWAKTPGDLAQLLNVANAPQRLRDAEIMSLPSGRQIDPDWKVTALIADVKRRRPRRFAFADDQFGGGGHSRLIVDETTPTPSLMIRPDSAAGLTRAHLQQLEDFFGS